IHSLLEMGCNFHALVLYLLTNYLMKSNKSTKVKFDSDQKQPR
ncbi:1102_t:CDS:2, partial [Gigaspora rosea]